MKGLPDGLLDPAAWPGPVEGPQLVETHISWVFLTGRLAYKVKKPVRFDFLDFSTRERRSHFCEEELRLNRRFAPGLYLGLSRIVRTGCGLAVDRQGELVEHAVRMRQFDRSQQLDTLVEARAVGAGELRRLGERIATQQAAAPAAGPPCGDDGALLRACRDNLSTLREAGAQRAAVEALARWTETEHARLAPLLARRRAAGRWRECHGDLHCANVVRHDGELWPFDAIEFDPALRWIDGACDVAFLWMDLEARDRTDLAAALLDGWLQESGDFEALEALRLFGVYRAGVRAKVAALRHAQSHDPATQGELARYLVEAARLAAARAPRLIVTTGLAASGKSHVAEALLGPLGAVRVRSDVERKRLAGLRATASSGGTIYGPEMTARTYARLADAAAHALAGGFSVVVDAACLLRRERDTLRALARARGAPFRLLEVTAPRDMLEARLAARAAAGTDPSEATREVLEKQMGFAEPPGADERNDTITVDGSRPVDAAQLAARLLAAG
jgi:aminoglycoside phosphotransferase family enzyme/predicted kinase